MPERFFTIINDIRRKGLTGRKSKRNFIVSFVLSVVLVAFLFNLFEPINNILNERNTYRIFLCNSPTSEELIQDWERNYNYVPDYNAKVNIQVPESLVVNNKIGFSVSFQDTGIIQLDNPFYYIFLIDPEGKARAMFPNIAPTNSGEPSCYQYSQDLEIKRSGWRNWVESDYRTGAYYVPTDKGIQGFSRNKLLGNVSNTIIKFSYVPDIKGRWEIKFLLFNSNYKNRQGYGLNNALLEHNAVKIETSFFDVNDNKPDTQNALQYFLAVFGSLIGSLGLFYIALKKFGDKIEKNLKENAWGYLVVSVLILISLAIVELRFAPR